MEKYPFPRTMMGVDVLMARGLIEAGFTIVHDADEEVLLSHDYEPLKLHWRGTVDAKFNAVWLDRVTVRRSEDILRYTFDEVHLASLCPLRHSDQPLGPPGSGP